MTQASGESGVPDWLSALARTAAVMQVPAVLQPRPGGRPAAVLILFGLGPDGPDLLLVQRGPGLRQHAGQPAFPGGAIDESDDGPVQAALREAAEEARVDPSGVQVIAVLPEMFIWRSEFTVTPVLAWWRRPAPVGPGDPVEVAAVESAFAMFSEITRIRPACARRPEVAMLIERAKSLPSSAMIRFP